jgi:hypothetical protein
VALPIPDELVAKIDAIAEAEGKADKRGRQAKQPLKLRVEHWSIHDSDDESGSESDDGELDARRERDAREMAEMAPRRVERVPNQQFIDPTFASIVPDDDSTVAFGSSSADEDEDAEGAVDPQPMVYGNGIESHAGHGRDQQEESSSDSEPEPEPGGGDVQESGGEPGGSDADGSRVDMCERESEPGGDAAAAAAAAAGVQAPAPAAGVQAPPPASPQASDREEVWVDTVDEEEDVEPADPVLVSVPEGGSAWKSRLRQNPRKKVAAARWVAGRRRNPTRSRGGKKDQSKRKCEEAVFNLTVKAAINKLGDAAVVSVAKEILQLQDRRTFRRFPAEDITPALAKLIISSSCFLKEKFKPDGAFDKLKARLVAGGHMQDRSVFGENTDSPTVSTTSVFIIAGIAAREGRAVATVDFPGAYLHADLPDDGGPPVLMRLNRYETGVLVAHAPEYKRDVHPKTGTLVVQLKKGLYGLIQSARLWYDKVSKDFELLGFKRNPHDMCVFNKIEADGSQTTLLLHVDDVLVTAKSEQRIDTFLAELEARYANLEKHRGRELDYLGMTMSWRDAGKVKITMQGYINETLEFAAHVAGTAKTPALDTLFAIDKSLPALPKVESELFHSLTAKLLYLGKRARPDILLAISFLARRVQAPTSEDADKLARVVRYLRHTRHLGMVLEPDSVLQAYAWIDASFAVHEDMKSHTGAVIGIGKGPFYAKSCVQRLNTKSSTEAELVGVSDAAGQLLWTRQFLEEQGYELPPATLYQDNMSTIALLNNGRSGSERTRHIAIRYFFLKDRIDSREVRVEYLPTGDMVADILTKPLQGAKFTELRDKLLNWPAAGVRDREDT